MIKSLVEHYDVLASDPDSGLSPMGFSTVKVSAYIDITNPDNPLINDSFNEDEEGKKKTTSMVLPFRKARSGKNSYETPYFLCDTTKFIFGKIKNKENTIEYPEYFNEMYNLHFEILQNFTENEKVQALLKFFENIKNNEIFSQVDYTNKIFENGNLVFRYDSEYLHEDIDIKKVYKDYINLNSPINIKENGICSITGSVNIKLAKNHSIIKEIGGTVPRLISNNNIKSNDSYNKSEYDISEDAMLKYTDTLNTLLVSKNKKNIAGTSILFWAERGLENESIALFFSDLIEKDKTKGDLEVDSAIQDNFQYLLDKYKKGRKIDKNDLKDIGINENDANKNMYLLGIYAASSGRAAIQFFYKNKVSNFFENIIKFHEELEIIKSESDEYKRISFSDILKSIAIRGEYKEIPNSYKQALFNSILNGTKYTTAVYIQILNRIKAEQYVSYEKVAFIKACLIRNYKKEEATVSLNEECKDIGYLCGRYFAIQEYIQEGSKIREKYYGRAMTNPASVFVLIEKNSTYSLNKKDDGFVIWITNKIASIFDNIGTSFPKNLNLEQQGLFILGYYHQRANLYTKKEKNGIATGITQ